MSAEEIFLHKRALKAQLLGASCKAEVLMAGRGWTVHPIVNGIYIYIYKLYITL